jgi:hypothetical protein
VLWRELEPQPGQYDFAALDAFVSGYAAEGRKVWLAIETVGADMYGVKKAPEWVVSMGARWHSGTCRNGDGMFAPWDETYRQRISLLLKTVQSHIAAQSLTYRNAIGGIVAMSGGMYGEMQLWSCGMELALHLAYGYGTPTDPRFVADYTEAVVEMADLYYTSFPGMPVMFQIGYSQADEAVVSHIIERYGERGFVKWAGLDPTNVGDGKDGIRQANNQFYLSLYGRQRYSGHWGFETGHEDLLVSEERFTNLMNWALQGRAEYLCVPVGALNRMMSTVNWRGFDAALQFQAVTPVATATPSPTATVAPTVTPEPARMRCECTCWEVR